MERWIKSYLLECMGLKPEAASAVLGESLLARAGILKDCVVHVPSKLADGEEYANAGVGRRTAVFLLDEAGYVVKVHLSSISVLLGDKLPTTDWNGRVLGEIFIMGTPNFVGGMPVRTDVLVDQYVNNFASPKRGWFFEAIESRHIKDDPNANWGDFNMPPPVKYVDPVFYPV